MKYSELRGQTGQLRQAPIAKVYDSLHCKQTVALVQLRQFSMVELQVWQLSLLMKKPGKQEKQPLLLQPAQAYPKYNEQSSHCLVVEFKVKPLRHALQVELLAHTEQLAT